MIVTPNVLIQVHSGEHGPIIRELRTHNIIPLCGRNHIRDVFGYPDEPIPAWGATPRYIAIGTDGTDPADGNTGLGSEVLRKEITRRYAIAGGLEFYLYITTAEANNSALREIALFTEPGTGQGLCWNRALHPLINKTSSIAISYRVRWTFANGGA